MGGYASCTKGGLLVHSVTIALLFDCVTECFAIRSRIEGCNRSIKKHLSFLTFFFSLSLSYLSFFSLSLLNCLEA